MLGSDFYVQAWFRRPEAKSGLLRSHLPALGMYLQTNTLPVKPKQHQKNKNLAAQKENN